jgi:hypothetical protein
MEHAFTFSLALCVGLNMADGIITVSAADLPGLREVNPLARLALKSPALFLAFKGLSSFVIYKGLGTLFKRSKLLAWVMVFGFDVVFSYAIIHNLHLIGGLS